MQIKYKSSGRWLTLACSLAIFLAGSLPGWAQEKQSAAQVITLIGQAEIKSPQDADYRKAQLRDLVYQQDLVRTGEKSGVRLFFQDESILVLGENTTLDIAKFQMDAQGRRQGGLMKLVEGSLRFIVHKFMTTEPNFEIEGKTAIMGVRGTDGAFITHSPDNIYSFSGPLRVKNMKTGESINLGPGYHAVAAPGQKIKIDRTPPGTKEQLLKSFRLAQRFIPERPVQTPLAFGNPFIRQDSPFRDTFNPTAVDPTKSGTLPLVHQPINPKK